MCKQLVGARHLQYGCFGLVCVKVCSRWNIGQESTLCSALSEQFPSYSVCHSHSMILWPRLCLVQQFMWVMRASDIASMVGHMSWECLSIADDNTNLHSISQIHTYHCLQTPYICTTAATAGRLAMSRLLLLLLATCCYSATLRPDSCCSCWQLCYVRLLAAAAAD